MINELCHIRRLVYEDIITERAESSIDRGDNDNQIETKIKHFISKKR